MILLRQGDSCASPLPELLILAEPLSMSGRYRKQTLFAGLGEAGQDRLRSASVALIGCGALGSVIAESLVRAGVGTLRLVDRDFVELSNLQRQVLYDEDDVARRLPKAIAASEKLQRINSEVSLSPLVSDVNCHNILSLIEGADVVLDGTDNFETRFLINDACMELSIPWIHAGCVGSHGQTMTVIPHETPCLRCLMPEAPGVGAGESCDTAGVIGPAVQIMASLQVVDALKILSGHRELISPRMTIVDVWEGTFRHWNLSHLDRSHCPCCSGTERPWLNGERGTQSTVLCGRNSVQLTPTESGINFDSLKERLTPLGAVRVNPFLMVFQPADAQAELTLFRDGRAIITGTEDIAIARSLYARYIGT